MMKLKLSIFSLFITAIATEELDCDEIAKTFRPWECCTFPLVYLKPGIYDECSENCRKTTSKDPSHEDLDKALTCCVDECLETEFPFYIDGKLNAKNILESFSYDMEAKNMPVAEWQTTFDQSIAACEKLGPMFDEIECGNKTLNYTLGYVAECMINMNFYNCPATSFTATEECIAMTKMAHTISKCGQKRGDTFILDVMLFEPKVNEGNSTDEGGIAENTEPASKVES